VTSSYLFLNGLRFHYLHWNLQGAGQQVILLHDLSSTARMWERVAVSLMERGCAVIAPDLRGHGLTDKPDGDYSFETYTADLSALVDACNLEKPVLVGHAWGGMLGIEYAARFPLGPHAPAGLVLFDGGIVQPGDSAGMSWERFQSLMAPTRLDGAPLQTLLARLDDPRQKWRPGDEDIALLLSSFEILEDDTLRSRLRDEQHMQILHAIWDYKAFQRIERVRCPVCLLPVLPPEPHSAAEAHFLQDTRRGISKAQERLLDLQVSWMPGAGRQILLQNPDQLGERIFSFINSLPR
jgi:pimeloyl-ACP methyl ester carboxylesterase